MVGANFGCPFLRSANNPSVFSPAAKNHLPLHRGGLVSRCVIVGASWRRPLQILSSVGA